MSGVAFGGTFVCEAGQLGPALAVVGTVIAPAATPKELRGVLLRPGGRGRMWVAARGDRAVAAMNIPASSASGLLFPEHAELRDGLAQVAGSGGTDRVVVRTATAGGAAVEAGGTSRWAPGFDTHPFDWVPRPAERVALVVREEFVLAVKRATATSAAEPDGGGEPLVQLEVGGERVRLVGGNGRRVAVAPVPAGWPAGTYEWDAVLDAQPLGALAEQMQTMPGEAVWIGRTTDDGPTALVLVCGFLTVELGVRDEPFGGHGGLLAEEPGPPVTMSREDLQRQLARAGERMTRAGRTAPFLVDLIVGATSVVLVPAGMSYLPVGMVPGLCAVIADEAQDRRRRLHLGDLEAAVGGFSAERVVIHLGAGHGGVVTVVDAGCDPGDRATYQQRLVRVPLNDC